VSREIPFWEVTLRGRLDGLPCGSVVSRRDDQVLVRVGTRAELGRILELAAQSDGGGPELVSVSPARQSLEDLFLRETRAAAEAATPAEAQRRAG
jgi:hypothetical protein